MENPTALAPAPAAADVPALEAELARLNDELRVLRSSDLSARAYFELWFAIVAWCVVGKLLLDWYRSLAKWPWLAIPVVVLGAWLTVDVVRVRRRRAVVAGREDIGLARQRELRRLLGVDDAPLPATAPRPAA
jgi:hypothetical protein